MSVSFPPLGDQTRTPCVGGFRQTPSDGHVLWGTHGHFLERKHKKDMSLRDGAWKKGGLEGLALSEPLRITP